MKLSHLLIHRQYQDLSIIDLCLTNFLSLNHKHIIDQKEGVVTIWEAILAPGR